MAPLPTVRIEIGFTSPVAGNYYTVGDPIRGQVGVYPVGPDDIWVDVTPWVRSWRVALGSGQGNSPTRRYDPGTATIVFNDGDRRFDPDNLAGPYVVAGVSQITPMRRVRITAEWNGVAYPLCSLLSDDWEPEYIQGFWTYSTLTATDATKVFANENRTAVAAVGAGELSGARITRILNSIDWPLEDRVIDTGDVTVQATDLSGNALAELQLIQDTEGGDFFVDKLGRAVFQDRSSVTSKATSITSQATFGDAQWIKPITYDFSGGVAAWNGISATVAQSTAQAFPDPFSLLLTVTGSPTQAYTRPVYVAPVEGGRDFTASMWVYYPAGGNVTSAIDWHDASGAYLSGRYVNFAVAANTWTEISCTGTAPANAAGGRIGPTITGSPVTGTQLYLNAPEFGPTTPEIPYADVKTTGLDDTMANRVVITRAGGAPQVAQDAASQTAYLTKSHEPGEYVMQTDAEALELANAILYRHKDPVRRFSRIEFNRPQDHLADVVWPLVLGLDFGNRITIRRRPAGGGTAIEHDAFVRGFEHQSDGESWQSALVLQATDRYSFYTVEHPVLGRVGFYPVGF